MIRILEKTQARPSAAPQGGGRFAAAPLDVLSKLSGVFLHIWAIILVIRMIALATRMISLYHPNHPSLMHWPAYKSIYYKNPYQNLSLISPYGRPAHETRMVMMIEAYHPGCQGYHAND